MFYRSFFLFFCTFVLFKFRAFIKPNRWFLCIHSHSLYHFRLTKWSLDSIRFWNQLRLLWAEGAFLSSHYCTRSWIQCIWCVWHKHCWILLEVNSYLPEICYSIPSYSWKQWFARKRILFFNVCLGKRAVTNLFHNRVNAAHESKDITSTFTVDKWTKQ